MKGRSIDQLVYEQMFPRPKSNDPPNFQGLLQRCLIPEVRHETQAFFGHLDTEEAKYPGLDYNHPIHRIRLSRWPSHARMFKAFDALGLTRSEVSGLTKWEGTKWAKDKYEKEQGQKIVDTTADGFPDWVEPEEEPVERSLPNGHTFISELTARSAAPAVRPEEQKEDGGEDDEYVEDEPQQARAEQMDNDSDEELIESVGVELNQRLRERIARLEAGESSVVMDEEWDQWFKTALESGNLASFTEQMTEQMLRSSNISANGIPVGLIPPSMLVSARAGRWSETPELLRPILRRVLESDEAVRRNSSSSSSSARRRYFRDGSSGRLAWPGNYSELRLSADGAGAHRGISPPGA